jgi:hypothetical protein
MNAGPAADANGINVTLDATTVADLRALVATVKGARRTQRLHAVCTPENVWEGPRLCSGEAIHGRV